MNWKKWIKYIGIALLALLIITPIVSRQKMPGAKSWRQYLNFHAITGHTCRRQDINSANRQEIIEGAHWRRNDFSQSRDRQEGKNGRGPTSSANHQPRTTDEGALIACFLRRCGTGHRCIP